MIEVYKYGGTLLKDKTIRKKIYSFIKSKIDKGIKIIMVVSAFGRKKDSFSTDNLSENIDLLNNREKDQIITFGEIYSSLIVKNELLKEGIKVDSLSYNEIGIFCDNNYQEGNILDINMNYLEEVISNNDVVVVPGFIAESKEGNIISLGRNTSDLTAVIIAKYFNLEKANIIKEVDGVYKIDPKKGKSEKIIENISYEEVLSMIKAGSNMFSKKTLKYAKENNVLIEVKGIGKEKGSIIGNKRSDEDVVFIDKDDNNIKVVFKNMEVFNDIFKSLIENEIKIEDLVIENNIFYLKGDYEVIYKIISKYL